MGFGEKVEVIIGAIYEFVRYETGKYLVLEWSVFGYLFL